MDNYPLDFDEYEAGVEDFPEEKEESIEELMDDNSDLYD